MPLHGSGSYHLDFILAQFYFAVNGKNVKYQGKLRFTFLLYFTAHIFVSVSHPINKGR